MAGQPSGAVAEFCATLRRLVRDCGIPQAELARALHRAESTVSELLGGHRATPPPLADVLKIVEYCRLRPGSAARPGLSLDAGWWRTRHGELEHTFETRRRVPAPRSLEPGPAPDGVRFDFVGAVEVLTAGRRTGFDGIVEDLLEPLTLSGSAPADPYALFEGFGARVRAARGVARTALLCAADVVIQVTAFCNAVAVSGIVQGADLGDAQGDIATEVLAELAHVDLGSARVRAPRELREEVAAGYRSAGDIVHGLGASFGHLPEELARDAMRQYDSLLARVTWDCPELRLTSETHEVDRDEEGPAHLGERTGLDRLGLLLSAFADGGAAPARDRERLRAPIASTDGPDGPHPVVPTLAEGYVDPGFRVASHLVDRELSSDVWWERQPLRDDLADFLAAHLLTDRALRAPLLVLGHPGSGKSLLTKLIGARLPEAEFHCVRVELRHVPADLDVQGQIEEAVFRATGRRTPWPDVCAPGSDLVRVVLLDGFDELLQAGAERLDTSRQWDYLRSVQRLQEREAEWGRPMVAVVTSRTVVADQADTPPKSTVVRLEPFDDGQIQEWLGVWNSVNRRSFAAQDLRPLTWDVVRPHRELARQPLLLLMLALYDASGNRLRRLEGQDIGRVGLYERLLVEFVRRQVVKRLGPLPQAAEDSAVEEELRRLGVIAVGMLHRGRQSIAADDADRDLATLLGEESSPLLFGRFFFVHEAQALVSDEAVKSYEFLHATFGEYLAARFVRDELWQAVARHGDGDGPGSARLRALLSPTPLTDRAEVLRDMGELLADADPVAHRALGEVLRELIHDAPWDTAPGGGLPYRPVRQSATGRQAVYEANLLLLTVLAEGTVRASDVLGADDPVDRWSRCAQLWRSQFGEASWEAFTRTLVAKHQDPGRGPGGSADVRISLRLAAPSTGDLPRVLPLGQEGGNAFRHLRSVDPDGLVRRSAFLQDGDTGHLLHALSPLLTCLAETLSTHVARGGSEGRSLANALVALACRPATDPAEWTDRYHAVLPFLPSLPAENGWLVADVLARHLVHDASQLPGPVVLAVLQALTAPHFGGLAPQMGTRVWLTLLGCVQEQVGRADVQQEQLAAVAAQLHLFLAFAQEWSGPEGPQELLLGTVRAAGSTHVWHRTGHPDQDDVLEDSLNRLERTPRALRSPEAVVGLLRLARELGRDDWLAEHAEPLLLDLEIGALGRLRATDVDALRPLVRDTALLAVFDRIETVWRGGPGGSSTG
ncbi:NACHT domain-containing protein [Streptomyces sp. NPDC059070]|uniref:NACHT domain-containing protein n=1 Tax=Streptomyces sp. NPDC059070 TaxID=3346713 RepID=UPI003682FD23